MPREGFIHKSMLASMAEFNDMTLVQLARIVYQTASPSQNQMRAARRALDHLLKRKEIIQSPYRDKKGDRCFSLPGGARKHIKRNLSVVKS